MGILPPTLGMDAPLLLCLLLSLTKVLAAPRTGQLSAEMLQDGNSLRQLDTLGGGNILRQLDTLGQGNILRQLDTLGGGNILRQSKRGFDAMSGLTFGKSKKNFDEIDRAGFGRFVKRPSHPAKKNFDEIDNVGFRGFY